MAYIAIEWTYGRPNTGADQAADIALTEGWHNTDGGSCSIVAG